MTFVSYELADGTTTKSWAVALASGQSYKTIFTEDKFAELHPTEPTEKEKAYLAKRFECLEMKHKAWVKAHEAELLNADAQVEA